MKIHIESLDYTIMYLFNSKLYIFHFMQYTLLRIQNHTFYIWQYSPIGSLKGLASKNTNGHIGDFSMIYVGLLVIKLNINYKLIFVN